MSSGWMAKVYGKDTAACQLKTATLDVLTGPGDHDTLLLLLEGDDVLETYNTLSDITTACVTCHSVYRIRCLNLPGRGLQAAVL